MATIAQSVGERGTNRDADVRTVQTLLNQHVRALGLSPLRVDGDAGSRTAAAIRLFQTRVARLPSADGRVDPGGPHLAGLEWRDGGGRRPRGVKQAQRRGLVACEPDPVPEQCGGERSGAGLCGTGRQFLAALRAAGASVTVSATRRNKTRVYLMHYSWKLAKGSLRAADVPAEPGCEIVWDHGDEARSRAAAQEMVNLFHVVYEPNLKSRHIDGLAIDMTISWSGTLKIRGADGKDLSLSSPSDGSDTGLHSVGAGYGVKKLVSDPPHWSDNGH